MGRGGGEGAREDLRLPGAVEVTAHDREARGIARSRLSIEGSEPTGYGLGKAGWVTVPLRAPGVDLQLLRDWIEESYRIVAPKQLVAELDG